MTNILNKSINIEGKDKNNYLPKIWHMPEKYKRFN